MRKAFKDYFLWVIDDKFVGVSLGYDFTAEHEWGIDDLKRRFGIPEASKKNMGIKNRVITKCVDNLIFKEETYKHQKCALLYTGYKYRTREEDEKYIPGDLKNYKEDIEWNIAWNEKYPDPQRRKDPIVTAWDGESFGIGVMGEKEVEYLKELYDALQKNNVAITHINLMPNNPFSNSSLLLLILDRIPGEALDMMYAADKKYYDRVDYEEKIGMTKIKEKCGNKNGYNKSKYYMACSAKWIDYDDAEAREKRKKELNTKYDIQYWINYSDDDENCGWYTVEEIKEWLTGPKKLTEIRKG
jgi:hypothetical protein